MKTCLRYLVLLIAVVALVATPQAPSQAQQPRRGGTLRIALSGEPPTLDHHRTASALVANILNNINEGLFALNSKFEPKPMLVDTWSMSPDRRTYTFVLRKGVKFHNGKDLTSEDVKASLERWGRLASRGRSLFAILDSIVTPDPHTIVVKLKEPYVLLPTDLAIDLQLAAIFPKEVVEEVDVAPLRRFIGTGPYKFVEYLPDRHVRLDRYEGYSPRPEPADGFSGRKHAYVDTIYFHAVPDASVRIAGVQTGEFHYARWVPTDEYARLRADPNLVPRVSKIPWELVGLFNHRSPLMSNRKVRQAVLAALDSEAVLRGTFGPTEFWRLNPGLLPKEHPMWTDAGKEHYNIKNPDRARQLLAEAGYKGEPLRWLATMEIPMYGISAQLIKPMLERAGFVVDLRFMPWATVTATILRPDAAGWDAYSTALTPQADPYFLVVIHPTGPGWYDNREIGALMSLMRRHSNPAVRRDLWRRLQIVWREDAGFVKFGDYYLLNVHRRELRGFTDEPSEIWYNAWLGAR